MNDKKKGRRDALYVVAVDIGGTNTEFAIIDRRGSVVGRNRISTTGHDGLEAYVGALRVAVDALAAELNISADSIAAVGAGAPAANGATGQIQVSTNLPWDAPVPLAKVLSDAFGIPAAITNDANAAAAGEMIYGVARGMRNFIVITLGTGVGSGIVCDGHLLSGSRGFAGELGHVVVCGDSDRPCGCGRSGCLETYCSARGIVETARRLLERDDRQSSLRNVGELTAKTIAEAAANGDELAREVYDFTGKVLGEACASFASFTDPTAIILFGGVAKAGNLLIEPMKRAMEPALLHLYQNRIEIMQSGLNDAEAALLGASAVAWELADRQ